MRLAILPAALSSALAAAASYPADFGVDVVFPRHNVVYKRAFPFPVVLAIHGAPEIWPTDLSIKLELMRALEKDKPATTFETVYVNATDVIGRLPGDEGTYFAVVGMLEASGSPTEDTFLRYGVGFPMDCEEGGEAAGRLADDFDLENSNSSSSSLYFKLNDEKGIDPDIVSKDKDECADHALTLLIEGKESEKCLLLGTPDYEALHEKCRTVIPEGFAEVVMKKVEEIGACADEGELSVEHDTFCNSKPFLADEERSGSGKSGSSGDGGDGDDDSGATAWRRGASGLASSAVLLLPLAAFLAW